MKVRIIWGVKDKRATYKVAARDLEAARKIIDKRDQAGSFAWRVQMSYRYDSSKQVTSITIRPQYKLTMPVWSNYPTQPKVCKDSWDNMWKKLKEHEDGHLKMFETGVRRMKKALETLGPATKPKDAETLHSRMVAEIQEESDKYDKKTDHGRKTGVILIVPQQCTG